MPTRGTIDLHEIARPEILEAGRIERNHLRRHVLCLFWPARLMSDVQPHKRRQVGAEIEITKEMIDKGAQVIEDMFNASPSMARRCAEEVFSLMLSAAILKLCDPKLHE